MIQDLSKYRRNKIIDDVDAQFTKRRITGVKPGEIFSTVSSIINPYGLPSVSLTITKAHGLADILIDQSESFMHTKDIYGQEQLEDLFELIGIEGICIEMKFFGCFYKLDGPIEGLPGCVDMIIGG